VVRLFFDKLVNAVLAGTELTTTEVLQHCRQKSDNAIGSRLIQVLTRQKLSEITKTQSVEKCRQTKPGVALQNLVIERRKS
jgi:hypothetical protein